MESKTISRTKLFLKIYFIFNLLGAVCYTLYFGIFGGMGIMTSIMAQNSTDEDIFGFIALLACTIVPLILVIVYSVGLFKINKKTKGSWIYMMVVVCLSMCNLSTIPVSIILLILLLDEEVKAYYFVPAVPLQDEVEVA